jgi:predicted permease
VTRSAVVKQIVQPLMPSTDKGSASQIEEQELAAFAERENRLKLEKLLKKGRDAGLPPREYELLALVVNSPGRFFVCGCGRGGRAPVGPGSEARGKRDGGAALCTMFMNAGNYGLPVARFAFGEEGLERAALFFVVQAVLAQTLAVYISGAGQGDLREGFRRLLRMAQLYAILAALAVRFGGAAPTLLVDSVLGNLFSDVSLVGDAAVPILLVVLGLQLAKAEEIREGRLVAFATGLRLLASVPIALLLVGLLGLDDLSADLAVLLASRPTAVNMSILTIEFNVRPRFVGSVVTVSTAASVLTLTLLLILVQATQVRSGTPGQTERLARSIPPPTDPLILYRRATRVYFILAAITQVTWQATLLAETFYRTVPLTCSSRKPKRERRNSSGFSTCGVCPQSSITSSR